MMILQRTETLRAREQTLCGSKSLGETGSKWRIYGTKKSETVDLN